MSMLPAPADLLYKNIDPYARNLSHVDYPYEYVPLLYVMSLPLEFRRPSYACTILTFEIVIPCSEMPISKN